MYLLTIETAKNEKGRKVLVLNAIMFLSPADEAKIIKYLNKKTGKKTYLNLCAKANNCKRLCLINSGRMIFDAAENARFERTKLFHEDREAFFLKLIKEIQAAQRKANRLKLQLAVRLNGTSDIQWEKITVNKFGNIFQNFPFVQFFDYTKLPNRPKNPEPNYHLTFSHDGPQNLGECFDAFDRGLNVAACFETLPDQYLGRKVIDGDLHDNRFMDPPTGVWVGLLPKGKEAKNDQSGFVIRNY